MPVARGGGGGCTEPWIVRSRRPPSRLAQMHKDMADLQVRIERPHWYSWEGGSPPSHACLGRLHSMFSVTVSAASNTCQERSLCRQCTTQEGLLRTEAPPGV